ncbi:MAG TPA: hypothetical protein VGL65_13785 [Gemmatimonadales bacterium]
MATLTAVAVIGIALSAMLRADLALVAGIISILACGFVVFPPVSDLRADKALGFLEFDRVLPISLEAIGAARLLGAAIRTSPAVLFAVALIIGLNHGNFTGPVTVFGAIGIPLAAWLLITAAAWGMMAVNIRWNFSRIWWLPITLVFGPRALLSVMPPWMHLAVTAWLHRAVDAIAAFAGTPAGVTSIVALVIATPAAFFVGASALFATGLDRYCYDASAAVPVDAPAPKRELGAIGRGPMLAIARYSVRLATEQSRRRFILLIIFVAVLVLGSPVLKDYARFYVRALAALIPGGIALQLATARARGHLEGIQQLPHSAFVIGAGHLLAIVGLAVPGVAVWVLARAVTGIAPTTGNVVTLFGWLVIASWLASVAAIWLNSRRMLVIVAIPVAGLFVWTGRVGSEAVAETLRSWITNAAAARGGALLSLLLMALLIVGGLLLFVRALDRYEYLGARSDKRS